MSRSALMFFITLAVQAHGFQIVNESHSNATDSVRWLFLFHLDEKKDICPGRS